MRYLFLLILITISTGLIAQDDWDEITVYEDGINAFTKCEIGLKYSSSSVEGGVGILARYQLKGTVFIRAALDGFGRRELTRISRDYNYGGTVRLGIENRRWWGTDLYWYYGVHVGAGVGLYEDDPDDYRGVNISTGLLGGVSYIINDQLMLGFEIQPMVIFATYTPEENLPNSLEPEETSIVFVPSVNLLYRFNF